MLTEVELRQIALNRLNDADILFNANSFNGSIYVCGYSIEIGLKAKICATDWWCGFPSTAAEFDIVSKNFKDVKTHDLESLLRISGEESAIKSTCLADWSIVAQWTPESRYWPATGISQNDARQMIVSAKIILQALGIL